MDNQSNQILPNPRAPNYRIYLPRIIAPVAPVDFAAMALQPTDLTAGKEKIRQERKRRRNKLSKRRNKLLRKAYELQQDCDVDIHLVVRSRKNNQVWKYSNGYTPPRMSLCVTLPGFPGRPANNVSLENAIYPGPIIFDPIKSNSPEDQPSQDS
jgi:hypothetical protein